MKAYKFVSLQHAEAVARGSVRLGTAEEFRRMEFDELDRADPNELARTAPIRGGTETLAGDHPIMKNSVFMYNGDERVFTPITVTGERASTVLDGFLYCCSLQVVRDATAGEAIFEIADIEQFANRLAKRDELAWRSLEQGRVTYRDLVQAQSVVELAPVDPFEKHKRFERQNEYRLLWAAHPWEKTMIIEVPEVADLLRRVQ